MVRMAVEIDCSSLRRAAGWRDEGEVWRYGDVYRGQGELLRVSFRLRMPVAVYGCGRVFSYRYLNCLVLLRSMSNKYNTLQKIKFINRSTSKNHPNCRISSAKESHAPPAPSLRFARLQDSAIPILAEVARCSCIPSICRPRSTPLQSCSIHSTV
jgi:hypothetical protein